VTIRVNGRAARAASAKAANAVSLQAAKAAFQKPAKAAFEGPATAAPGEPAVETLLDVCRREGVDVPALCHDDRVHAGGHCRACMVEVAGRLVPACTTPVRDGMDIETESAKVLEYRRDLGELMLCESEPRGRVGKLLEDWGADGSRYTTRARRPRVSTRRDQGHPFLRIDLGACIRCRLCVSACAEIQGQFVWAVAGRGASTHVTWGSGDFSDSGCVSCGACASVCPTGAVSDIDRERLHSMVARGASTRVVRTTCSYCGVGCSLDVHVAGDDVVLVEGAPSPVNDGHLCVKGRYAHRFARHPDRLTTPLLRRDGELVPVSWEVAIAHVAAEMKRLAGGVGGLSSSRCTNEENYLLQKWMRAGLATNNVDCCARVCHAPSAAGLRHSFGTGAATSSLADIERADLLFVCGSNTTESHPIVGSRVKQAVLAGAGLIVVDPRRTELAALADIHLQPRPGTNVPLLNSLAAVIVDEGLVDEAFIAARTEGFEKLAAFVTRFLPEKQETTTGVAAPLVREAARLYASAERPMQLHGLGMTEHLQGSEGVMLLCNLALLRGAVGREGAGVNPLRGQNNVQGAADMGCQPDLLTGYASVADPLVRERFEAAWGAPLPTDEGLTLPRMYEAIDSGEIRGLFILGEDVVQTDPDCDRVRERLGKLELLVVQEIFLSETAKLAHVVLPGASAFEKDGTFTNGERRVQRVRRVLEPKAGSRADWEILASLMRAGGMDADYPEPRAIFEEIRGVWPALAEADYEALGAEGLQWPVTKASPAGTPILHRETFSRGRADLACVPFVASPAFGAGALTLITGRVLEHYNSGSMTRRSGAAHLVDRDELQIHPRDARGRGIRDGARVRVTSAFGEAVATARLTTDLRPGTLFLSFHFPETGTNRVTSDVVDRLAGCPEYKVTAVDVRCEDEPTPPPGERSWRKSR
jgi:formate dehydrogenase major subunit